MKLTKKEQELHDAGIVILETVSDEKSVISKKVTTGDAANIPDKIVPDLDRYIKDITQHELYGSLAMKSHTFTGRTPADVDIVVKNPQQKANRIAKIVRKHGMEVRVESNPDFNSHVVQISKKGRVWEDAVDIHPIDTHKQEFDVFGKSQPPNRINGMNIQRASDQLLRKANSVMVYNKKEKRMGAPKHRELKDTVDFITTSRLLLDSKQLQAEAELAQIKEARQSLNKWKTHAKSIKGDKPAIGKDPIPEYREQQFIRYAKNNPNVDVEDIRLNKSGAHKPKKISENIFNSNKLFKAKRQETNKKNKIELFKFGR